LRVIALLTASLLAAVAPALLGPSARVATAATAAAPAAPDQVAIDVDGTPLVAMTTSPITLSPAFSPTIDDYALRCSTGVNNVSLTLTGSGTITVGSQSARVVALTVPLGENQAIVVTAPAPGGGSTAYWIRCLPHDFPQMKVDRPGNPTPGWYLTGTIALAADGSSGFYAMVLDANGTPVWYQKTPAGTIDTTALDPHTIAWAPGLGPGIGADPNGAFTLYDTSTQTSRSLPAPSPPTDPHELLQLPNGDHVMISSPLKTGVDLTPLGQSFAPANDTIVDCVVQQFNDAGTVWSWRASDHIAVAEGMNASLLNVNGTTAADIYH